MTKLLKIDGYSELRKDHSTGAVINVDNNAYKAHLIAKGVALKNLSDKKIAEESISNMREEINNMKQDLDDIKCMLQALLNKGK
jgi:hypothetical protein